MLLGPACEPSGNVTGLAGVPNTAFVLITGLCGIPAGWFFVTPELMVSDSLRGAPPCPESAHAASSAAKNDTLKSFFITPPSENSFPGDYSQSSSTPKFEQSLPSLPKARDFAEKSDTWGTSLNPLSGFFLRKFLRFPRCGIFSA
jgi:hypothetical protein